MNWKPPFPNEPHAFRNGSPLIQEQYFDDQHARWKMLVTCLSLNLTTGKQARTVLPILFEVYDTPDKLADACPNRLYDILKPLGMVNKRVITYKRFSQEYTMGFKRVKDLYGCGQYAQDSDDIFFSGLWQNFLEKAPQDGELKRYVNFLSIVYNIRVTGDNNDMLDK